MTKTYTLIAGLALGLSGCATTQGAPVYLPGSDLSFRVGKDMALKHVYVALPNCVYHLDNLDNNENGPVANCPVLMRVRHTRNDGLIYLMAFPVKLETLRRDVAVLDLLEKYAERRFSPPAYLTKKSVDNDEYYTEKNQTWNLGDKGLFNESVVIFPVKKDQKELTVVMMGQWPVGANREMVKIQDQIAYDILGKY